MEITDHPIFDDIDWTTLPTRKTLYFVHNQLVTSLQSKHHPASISPSSLILARRPPSTAPPSPNSMNPTLIPRASPSLRYFSHPKAHHLLVILLFPRHLLPGSKHPCHPRKTAPHLSSDSHGVLRTMHSPTNIPFIPQGAGSCLQLAWIRLAHCGSRPCILPQTPRGPSRILLR